MKKFVSIILSVIMVLSLSSVSFAVDFSTGAVGFTREYVLQNADDFARERAALEQKRANMVLPFAFGDGEWDEELELYEIDAIEQEKNYYCGPACMEMAHQIIRERPTPSNPSQDYYAEWMGLEEEGCTDVQVRNTWNDLHGNTLGRYYRLQTDDQDIFETDIQYSIYSGMPVFVPVHVSELEAYEYFSHDYYHWILVAGYAEEYVGYDEGILIYYDPNLVAPGAGRYIDTASNIFNGVQLNYGIYLGA